MIAVLNNRRSIGAILVFSGLMLMILSIVGMFPTDFSVPMLSCIGDLIFGEVIFFVGVGLYRGKPYANFFRVFEDCESKTGVMCSIAAGFGLGYLITGIVSAVSNDSVNAVGNIISGIIILVAPIFVVHFKKRTVGRVAHVAICISLTIVFIANVISLFLYLIDFDVIRSINNMFYVIMIFIGIIYVADASVKADIWNETPDTDAGSASV